MVTTKNTLSRLVRVCNMAKADPKRFAPSPLGPGFLTRAERYNEVRWELHRRLNRTATTSIERWEEIRGELLRLRMPTDGLMPVPYDQQ